MQGSGTLCHIPLNDSLGCLVNSFKGIVMSSTKASRGLVNDFKEKSWCLDNDAKSISDYKWLNLDLNFKIESIKVEGTERRGGGLQLAHSSGIF